VTVSAFTADCLGRRLTRTGLSADGLPWNASRRVLLVWSAKTGALSAPCARQASFLQSLQTALNAIISCHTKQIYTASAKHLRLRIVLTEFCALSVLTSSDQEHCTFLCGMMSTNYFYY
jgi:hypothetical protein